MALPTVAIAPNVWDAGKYIVIVDSVGTARITTVAGDYAPAGGLSLQGLDGLLGTL